MKTRLLYASLVLTTMCLNQGAMVLANPPSVGLPNGSSQATCHHVIDLLFRYGTQAQPNSLALRYGDSVLLGDDIGDLELVSISSLDPGSEAAGPMIAITLRNNSCRVVRSFSVSAVAVLAQIRPWCPAASQRVKCLAAGETVELHLQLPLESLAMGRAGSQTLAFRKLVVAIDSFDELVESNESNNLAVIDRVKIAVAVLAPVATESTPTETQQQIESPPVQATPVEPVGPNVNKPRKSIDDLDFDKLEMEG